MTAFDLKLDPITNDIVIDEETGDLVTVEGAELVAQRLTIVLRSHQGEWLLDASFGIPYRESVLVKGPDLTSISAIFQQTIISTPGVARITSYQQQLLGRSLTVQFEVETEDEDVLEVADEVDVMSGIASFFITAKTTAGVLSWTVE